jgi:hypothetical protein
MFVDSLTNDYHLQAASPAIDKGNPDQQYNDPEDPDKIGFALYPAQGTLQNDMGAYGGPFASSWDLANIVEPPLVPTNISPSNGATEVPTTLLLSWNSSWGTTSCQLQVSTSSDFSSMVIDTSIIGQSCGIIDLSNNATYYWRVKAIDSASNESAWSQSVMLNSGLISSGVLTLLSLLVIVAIAVVLYILIIRPATKKRKAAVPTAAPEIIIPEVVNTEYRTFDSEDTTKRRALPWRLALPQAPQLPKGGKTISPEDHARLKVIIDFAKSLPLVECGNNTNWLIDMAENGTGSPASPILYAQLLKGEIQVRYEPAWIRHPIFRDLQDLLEGQSVLQDLNSFVDSVNRTTSDAIQLLQDMYKDTTTEITWDILANGGWGFISGVYNDSISWFLGKYLREPSDRDYTVKQEGETGEGMSTFGLYGAQNTPFAGLLVQAPGEKEASQLRTLHLKLRRMYRNNDKAKDVVSMLTQLDVQRNRLLNAFSQLNRINP